jgi:transposase
MIHIRDHYAQKREALLRDKRFSALHDIGDRLGKACIPVAGVDARGRAVLSRRAKRSQLLDAVASLPPCVIEMEAGGSAHHSGRAFEQLGHTVKLMNPKYV